MYKVKEGKEHTNNGFTQLNMVDLFINQGYTLECLPAYHRTHFTIKDVHRNLHI